MTESEFGPAAGAIPCGLVSTSAAMQSVLANARKVACTDSSILILGETGVGKGRLARSIHAAGERRRGPVVPMDCAAVPESLFESELFGHEVGAFTGASRTRKGYVERACGGTLFLDEIGEIPPHIQVKLLRVLEDREIHRVGGERAIRVDARIIAATNRDLEVDMRDGRFREDLFYRLAVVTLTLPPLRDRTEEIEAIARGFLVRLRRRLRRPLSRGGG